MYKAEVAVTDQISSDSEADINNQLVFMRENMKSLHRFGGHRKILHKLPLEYRNGHRRNNIGRESIPHRRHRSGEALLAPCLRRCYLNRGGGRRRRRRATLNI